MQNRIILPFEGISNARDMGGILTEGGTVKGGRLIRCGCLYRSTDSDLRRLSDMGVSLVVDFRTDTECENEPDRLPDKARYVRAPILGEQALGITKGTENTPETLIEVIRSGSFSAEEYMKNMYRGIIGSETAWRGYSLFFKSVLEADGAVLWHCTAGKDRTGIAAALMLLALGADKKTCKDDYLLTNVCIKREIEAISHKLLEYCKDKEGGEIILTKARIMFSVHESYIQSAFDMIDKLGGTEVFLRDKLRLGAAEIKELRERFLCRQGGAV